MKRLCFLTVLSLCSALFFAYLHNDDGFRVANITLSDVSKKWMIPNQHVAIVNEVSEQPFFYLGKGRQCYAFSSADGRWVLKFFKCQRLRLSTTYKCIDFLGLMPETVAAKRKEKNDRMKRLFTSACLAATKLADDTGIAYMQLTPSEGITLPTITLISQNGKKEYVDLNTTPFCLQRKGDFILPILEELIVSKDFDAAKKRLDQLFDLVVDKRKKWVSQNDHALIKRNNVGFLEDHAIFLDIGSFKSTDQPKRFKAEKLQLKPLVIWLKGKNLMLATYFEERVNAL